MLLDKSIKTKQSYFTCNEPEIKACRYELYKHIEIWLIEQDIQHMILDIIMAAISKHTIKLSSGYDTYWDL